MVTAWGRTVLFQSVSFHFSQAAVSQNDNQNGTIPQLQPRHTLLLRVCPLFRPECGSTWKKETERGEGGGKKRGEEREFKPRGRRKFMSLLWNYTWQLRERLLYIMLLLCLLCGLMVVSTGPRSGSGATCNCPLSDSTYKRNRLQHRFYDSVVKIIE